MTKEFSNETIERIKKPDNAVNIIKYFIAVLGIFVLIVLAYLIYVVISYTRIVDNLEINVNNQVENKVDINKDYKIVTYNIGFCAYTSDFGFFMDGGTESRAKSRESVENVVTSISELISGLNPDFCLFQEVDVNSTRSYHINQRTYLEKAFLGYTNTFAVNYDSPFLMYPIFHPIGKSLSGIETISKYTIDYCVRRSLPVEKGFYSLIDLDRCFTKNILPITNDKNLILYNVHLSAYTSDGTIALKQIDLLLEDMIKEYEKGNYLVCGGDFNKDLLLDSSKYFGISTEGYTWAQAFPIDKLENTPIILVSSVNDGKMVPSCRNADGPYNEKQLVLTVDGFLVSNNVDVVNCEVIDTQFAYSDHNPVQMTFRFK